MEQRLDEWISLTDEYHTKQFREPMRSTVAFCDWLEAMHVLHNDSRLKILDMCSGYGANIAYMAKRFPYCAFLGIDIISDLVQRGNRCLDELQLSNCRLERGDLFNLEKRYIGQFDGITCYQTLSWLPEFQTPLAKMLELDPNWVGLTSLFFDGDVSCRIEVQDRANPKPGMPFRESFYNVYAIPQIKQQFEDCGFDCFSYAPFEIDVDLPKPASNVMGTYTVRLEDGKRLQISGPLLMNWYFVLGKKMHY
jgi:SAM-dependent methyltransferase